LKGLTIDEHGGLDKIRYREDLPEPARTGALDVRVRVRAAALNRLDLWTIGGLPGINITPGWVLGADATGIIEEVGADVGARERNA